MAFNYIRILGDCFPGDEAYVPPGSDPFVYTDLVWATAPVSQAVLEASECASVDEELVAATQMPTTQIVGKIFEVSFVYGSVSKNKWLSIETQGASNASNEIPYIIPWDSRLAGITFTNATPNADTNIQLWRANVGSEPNTGTLIYTWEIRNTRSAINTDLPIIAFKQGDKAALFLSDQGTDVVAPLVRLAFLGTNYTVLNTSESYSTNF